MNYTAGMSFEEFTADQRTIDAVLLNLQIMGEAVKQLPQEKRAQSPKINWRNIAGLRDIIVHTYFQIDLEIIWDIVQNKISELYEEITQISH